MSTNDLDRVVKQCPPSTRRLRGSRERLPDGFSSVVSAVLAIGGLAFFLRRAAFGLHAIGFNDESMHILGGRALNAGDRLYHDFVDVHGPGIFMLAQIYGAVFGWANAIHVRLVIAALALLAGIAVGTSPCLHGRFRGLAVSLYFGLLATVWLVQGLFWFSYYPISGSFTVIILVWFVVPAYAGAKITAPHAIAAGAASACLAFTSYSEAPTALLLSASGCLAAWKGRQRPACRAHVVGVVVAGVLLVLWLVAHGDVVGYLAFHVALTLTAYQAYGPLSFYGFADSLTLSPRPDHLVQDAAIIFGLAGSVALFCLALKPGFGRVAAALSVVAVAASLVLLDLRGLVIFQNGAFLVSCIGLLSVAGPAGLQRLPASAQTTLWGSAACLLTVLLTEGAMRYAVFSPSGLTRAAFLTFPTQTIGKQAEGPLFDAVRRSAHPEERILILVYRPDLYWAADRLPISGIYEYLPFDALYAKYPWFGQKRDLCDRLARSPPPVILFDDWTVWGRYKPITYMNCLFQVISRYTYVPEPGDSLPNGTKLYVRSDRAR